MEESRYSTESTQVFDAFFDRYKKIISGDYLDHFGAKTQDEAVRKFLDFMNQTDRLTLYHGTHSAFVQSVLSRKLVGFPLFLGLSPFQTAQYALQRAYTENAGRRLNNLPKVQPGLLELSVDLKGLDYEIINPSPNTEPIKKNIAIGVQEHSRTGVHYISEIQMVGKEAEGRLRQASIETVASGDNLKQLLIWSKDNIGSFPLEILL